MKIEKRWIVSFLLIATVSILGLFWPEAENTPAILNQFIGVENIVGADVAWLLTSSSLVLLMTPGLSFF